MPVVTDSTGRGYNNRLDRQNVKYLIRGKPLLLHGAEPIFMDCGVYVYENKPVLPRAFMDLLVTLVSLILIVAHLVMKSITV